MIKHLAFFVTAILFFVPFFWFPNGSLDIGGDATRIYFYDPLSYLEHYALFGTKIRALGGFQANYYNIPVIFFICVIKQIVVSPTLVVAFFNSLKLVGSFVAVYLFIKELLKSKKEQKTFVELSAILGGLFYIFFPFFRSEWDRSLLIHNQIFLNPLLSLLFLKFILYKNNITLWCLLLVSLLFSINFSWASSPPMLAFFPLAGIFILLYASHIRKVSIPKKMLIIGFILFLLLHMFHFLPTFTSLTNSQSHLYERVFNKETAHSQLDYFHALLPLVSISGNFFLQPILNPMPYLSVSIFVIVGGSVVLRERKSLFVLSLFFFLISFFLVSAKISLFTERLYELLFLYIPGFTMFRNFIVQWLYIFNFFFSILLAQCAYALFTVVPKKLSFGLTVIILLSLFVNGMPLLKGEYVNRYLSYAPTVKNNTAVNEDYIAVIHRIQKIPTSTKILNLPFTDFDYQVIVGKSGGAYVGADTTGLLTGKNSFSGYFHTEPFSDTFLLLSQKKDYASLKRLLGMLNVQYILHNKDPYIYGSAFPKAPFEYMRPYLPKSQNEYSQFIEKLGGKKVYEKGSFVLYKLDKDFTLPRFFVASETIPYEDKSQDFGMKTAFFIGSIDPKAIFVRRNQCPPTINSSYCTSQTTFNKDKIPLVTYKRLNPSKYIVTLSNVTHPVILAFQESFEGSWKLYPKYSSLIELTGGTEFLDSSVIDRGENDAFFDSQLLETLFKSPVADDRHFMVNGYANAWEITPEDMGGKKEAVFVVEMVNERVFYIGTLVSIISCVIIFGLLVRSVVIQRKQRK